MRFIAEQVEPIPPITYEPPAVDYGDEFLLRREARAPSPRDMVNRRPPLPKWFRRQGPPDMSEGERLIPSGLPSGTTKNEMLYWDGLNWVLLTPPPDVNYKVLQPQDGELLWDWGRLHG